MTDNDVIKALECCICDDCDNCPNDFGDCVNNLCQEAINLINRQMEEFETYKKLYEDLKAENLETIKAIKGCKAEAIKEFVKKFEKNIKDVNFTLGQTWDIQTALEKTSKEMTEERK